MTKISDRTLGAIILAAGKGKRMKSKDANKVTLPLADKPLILHAIHLFENMDFGAIVVVVGFAKDSVKKVLKDNQIIFAEQTKRLGTAHAVKSGLASVPSNISDVLVIQGDDSHFYKEATIKKLMETHINADASLTFVTIDVENPFGLGRIVRNDKDDVVAIVEEKDATDGQKKIKEVNPACYVFKVDFLKKYLPQVQKSPITGEYYLTSLITIAIKYKEPIATLRAGAMPWRGVNTREELQEAEKLYHDLNQ